MTDVLNWMATNADWLWLCIGILLLAGEIIIPGIYLLWLGLASVATAFLVWVLPEFSFELQGVIFAVMTAVAVYIGHRFFYIHETEYDDKGINNGGQHHVGKIYVVVNPIENGRGHITVGDTRWLAEGPDSPEGTKVRVEAIEGTVMKVVPI